MLIICLVAFVAAAADAHRHPSSASRTFEDFLKLKIRNICGEVLELQQKVTDCCSQKGNKTLSVMMRFKYFPALIGTKSERALKIH